VLERAIPAKLFGAIVIILSFALVGCVNNATAPIVHKSAVRPESVTVHRAGSQQEKRAITRPASHTVQRGDTLYSIAWRFGIDFRSLSRWNRLSDPNLIHVGQRLRLSAPPNKRNKQPVAAQAKRPVASNQSKRVNTSITAKSKSRPVTWSWPADGAVQAASSALGTKGIEILGKRGTPVKAAASGTVVYGGSGLRGYGALIIVKHSEDFLSAYAHNERLLVSEGVTVKADQQIAEMGDSDAKRVMLHFEIRRDGKAVEPLDYLPRR
jgi:lipoprotein NlpD